MDRINVNIVVNVIIRDKGIGLEKARQPQFSTVLCKPGLGITIMEHCMDTKIYSNPGKGIIVNMKKKIE